MTNASMSIAVALDPRAIATALGGEANGGQILAPGPGHSADDRSLAIKIAPDREDGFIVYSFAGDDPLQCRDYVRTRLGLPEWEPKKQGKPWTVLAEHVYKDADNKPYLRVRKCVDGQGKKQYPQAHWDGKAWIKDAPKGPKVPYRLPELIAASSSATVFIAEGEKCCDALAKVGFVATCNSGGADEGRGKKWTADLSKWFRGRRVILLPDNDKLGHRHVQHVAKQLHGVAESVRIVDLAPHWPGEMPAGTDVYDWLQEHDRAGSRLAQLAKTAPVWEPGVDSGDARISELAGLSKLAYARRRKEEAEKLGITAAALDDAVKDARTAATGEELLYAHWNVEPWPEAIDTAVLLQSVHNRIKQHVIISDSGAIAVVLWTAMTWVHERSAVHSPLLMVTSAERDSGKSTLLGLFAFLVRRSLVSVGISAAALYRSIEKWQPAFVIDEADTIFRQNEDLREVVNSGWTRGQGVVRCQPETNEPKLFSTFCPKAIGLKGKKLPDTTLSRTIIVELKRKLPTEATKDFAHVDDDGLGLLRRKLARWAEDNADKVASVKATMPEGFINRVAANWRLLLAIAELAGGTWPERARKAAVALSGPETSLGVRLLADVQDAFVAKQAEELSTQELVDHLTALEDREWSELGHGKPITKVWLSRRLGEFGLASDKIGDRDSRLRGWRLSTFTEVFKRYLSGTTPVNSSTRPQSQQMGTSCEDELVHAENGGRVEKSQKPNNDGLVDECASLKRGSTRGDEFPDLPDCLRRCSQCNAPADARGGLLPHGTNGQQVWLHAVCVRFWEARWCK
jgi:Protein of unknown function (DUF3631)